MMDYDLFKKVVTERINDFLPPFFTDYDPVVTRVNKINEKKDALTMHSASKDDGTASPVLYLDDMYKAFIENEDIETILQEAADVIVNYTGVRKNPSKEFNFKELQDRIVPNLIGRQYNEELLMDVPHKEVLDMAVIYRIMMPAGDGGFDSLVINNHIFDELEMDLDDMHCLAIKNMKDILPMECNRISKEEYAKETAPQIPDSIIFVYTHQNVYGAAYMLHEDVMRKFARKLGCDRLYIVPASINYFAVCAAKERCLGFLVDHLHELNQDEDSVNGILSKCIYSYDVRKKILAEAASYDTTRPSDSALSFLQ